MSTLPSSPRLNNNNTIKRSVWARDESSKGRLRSAHFIQRCPRQGTTSLTLLITFRLMLHRRAYRAEPQDSTMSHKRYHATLNPFGNPHARGRAFTVYGTARDRMEEAGAQSWCNTVFSLHIQEVPPSQRSARAKPATHPVHPST